jgi:hypothetical protein
MGDQAVAGVKPFPVTIWHAGGLRLRCLKSDDGGRHMTSQFT